MDLKLDMLKAYNGVEWCCLQKILTYMGFSNKWLNLIITYVSFVSLFMLIIQVRGGILSQKEG